MFFKKKMAVNDYCEACLKALFETDREKVWEQLRQACNDPALSGIDKTAYMEHMRAIMIQLVLISIAKKFNMHISMDAGFFVMSYLKDQNATQIYEIGRTYNQVFGSTPQDGIAGIVSSFSLQLADGQIRQDSLQYLHLELYSVLNSLYDDFKSIKLTTKRV
jgi:hypothetical protein